MEVAHNLLVTISGCFKLLLIITTAMFAVAQYYDGRQRKFMTEDHNSIWVFHLHDIADPHMRDIKNEFDRLLNIEPINNQNIIICLWVLLVFYTLLLMIILIDLFWIGTDSASISSNYSHIMTISSIFLFIFSGWLTVNLMKMRTQLREFRKDAKALNKIGSIEEFVGRLSINYS